MDKGGRPLKEIDWDTVDRLCSIQCTGEEIASILNVDYDTLNAACKRVHGVGFSDYFKRASASGKMSLRRKQYEVALAGNPTMLIWLGKNQLGQSDRTEVDVGKADDALKAIADRLPD